MENTKQSITAKVFVHEKWEEIDTAVLAKYKGVNPSDWWIARDNMTPHKYQIAAQCIARQEDKYFKEWIEHHLHIGIEHIYIYDNNDKKDKYKLKEFLRKQLSEGDFDKIEVIPWHERMMFQQLKALRDCVNKHKDEIKWLLSIDLDEFLVLKKPMREFLNEFSYASQVYFSWESLGANGQIYYEDKPLSERFKKRFVCEDKMQGKVMFRPDRMKSFNIHEVRLYQGKTVNVLHKQIKAPDSLANIYEVAWIKHYFTKSLEEWTDKMKRGCADHLWGRKYDMFFEINPDLKEYYDETIIQVQAHGNSPAEKDVDDRYYDKTPLDKIQFEVSIVEHCNLNCAMCDHFSPLAKENFLDIDEFRKDMTRMSEIFSGEADSIAILGGEPTLHKGIAQFLEHARMCFKETEIRLYTNGLTLKKLPDSFWKSCTDNDVIIFLTRYPYIGEWNELLEFISSKGVRQEWADTDPVKMMTHMPLDLNGKQDAGENFFKCYHANRNIQLKNGKLFTCTVAACVCHFNKYFGKKLTVPASDFIDIYDVVTKEQLFRFLAEPKRFCKNCKIQDRTPKDWSYSKRVLEEWT